MNHNFSHSQRHHKQAARSTQGIVAAQHRRAAEVGAKVLAEGGDCVDAVVATSFAIGALEPWMSGVGGVGTMVLYRADEQRAEVIDFGGVAPAALDARDYPLAAEGRSASLFPWRRVVDDRNECGATSVAIPGVVAGMGQAHALHGRLPWRDLVLPAASLAREGMLVDWHTTLNIAGAAAELRRFPTAAAEFLVDGLPPSAAWGTRDVLHLPRPRYAHTLERIAQGGARSFYEGELARQIAAEVAAAGGCLRESDLAGYRARMGPTLAIPYRGAVVHATPELTAGPTLAQTLRLLQAWNPSGASQPDAAAYTAYAQALQQAYRQRLQDMGDADGRRAIGAEHLAPPTCTTHFSVVDARGNMAAVTQTLLGIFGSKFVTPDTGVLLNNGIMWFDPEPGRSNSLAGGRRCLANYTPAIAEAAPGRHVALGASGGRRILPAVAQLLSFVIDHRMGLQQAFDTPRIDASEGDLVLVDARLDEPTASHLAQHFDTERVPLQTTPMKFACPSAVLRDGPHNEGATELFNPWADAVAADAGG